MARTVRVTVVGEEHFERAVLDGRPLLFAAWHGQTHLLYPLIRGRVDLQRTVLMVVDDSRRHVLASFARAIDVQPYPIGITDQSIAGARNMLQLVRLLRQGRYRYSYITPDGPDGPARVAKPGAAFLAARAGALVLPLGSHTPWAYRLRRWDRYALPLPFSRIWVAARPALTLDRGDDPAPFSATLERELNQALQLAESMREAPQ